jgi:hypothetical protein
VSVSVLPAHAVVTWSNGDQGDAHDVVIMANGWLRVTWLTGATTHVSSTAVKFVHGKGVSYGA